MNERPVLSTKPLFPKDLTLIIKGILILWLIMHHSMGSAHYEVIDTVFGHLTRRFASLGGAVVSAFAFLSGYGLNETYKAWCSRWLSQGQALPGLKDKVLFSYSRGLRLIINLWIVYIIFVGSIVLFKKPDFLETSYNGNIALGMLKNLSGNLIPIKTGTVNSSWWFIAAILSFYLVFPFVKQLGDRWALPVTIASFLVTIPILDHAANTRIYWYFQFFIGFLFSQAGVFEWLRKHIPLPLLAGLSFVSFAAVNLGMIKICFYPLFPLWEITFMILMFSLYHILPEGFPLWAPLRFLGRYSSDMYLLHVFVHGSLFTGLVFYSMNPLWVVTVDTLICLALSLALSAVKQKTGLAARLGRMCPDKRN